MELNKRVANVQPSPTLALNQKANALRAEGKSIVNLTAGEPDFDTPKNICDAAQRAILEGKTRYTPSMGIPALKEAIIQKMAKEYDRKVSLSQVMVTTGAKQALFHICHALLNEGDEAIVLAPYWVSYPDMVKLAGGHPVFVTCEEKNEFSLDLEAIERAITSKTRLLFINSPVNPCGAMYSKAELDKLRGLLEKHPQVMVISDDIYEKLIYDDSSFYSMAMMGQFAEERVILVNGVSKSYAMTGWRIGYAVGNETLIRAMNILQSQSTSGATSIAQWAAVEAIQGDQSEVENMRKEFEKRRNLFCRRLSEIPNVTCSKPKGAFYTFFNVSSYLGKKDPKGKTLQKDVDLAAYLLDTKGVALVPGSVFGAPGFLRASFATNEEQLNEGASRILEGLSVLVDA